MSYRGCHQVEDTFVKWLTGVNRLCFQTTTAQRDHLTRLAITHSRLSRPKQADTVSNLYVCSSQLAYRRPWGDWCTQEHGPWRIPPPSKGFTPARHINGTISASDSITITVLIMGLQRFSSHELATVAGRVGPLHSPESRKATARAAILKHCWLISN